MRHKKVVRRTPVKDKVYQDVMVAKFINNIMHDGKKSVAENLVYDAFTLLKEQKHDPLDIFNKAIQNVGPKVEVRARRMGGASYQVPTEIRGERRTSLAVRWIIESARARSNKDFHRFEAKLAAELLDASQNQGSAIKKRDNVLRMAEANRAFAHFRW